MKYQLENRSTGVAQPRRRRIPLLVSVSATMVSLMIAWLPGSASASTSSAPAPAGQSLVTIVHGLRGQLVDVYLDSTLLLPAFAPDRLTDPTPIPSGQHRITLRKAGTPPDSAPEFDQEITVPTGKNLSAVAHFTPEGAWTVSIFDNDVAPPPPGESTVVFRNTAGISPVDVAVNGNPAAPGLASSQASSVNLAPATYSVGVTSAADGSTLIPADNVPVAASTVTFLYLVGQGQGLTWLAQKTSETQVLAETLPSAVTTGNSGIRATYESSGAGFALGWKLALGGSVMALGLVAMRSRRASRHSLA